MFVLQAAVTKGLGGVLTAATHYARMFDEVGVGSACFYRGPGPDALRDSGVHVLDAPATITSPLFPLLPLTVRRLRRRVLEASGGEAPSAIIVHSDLALPALKHLFPEAQVVAVCHSDKMKRKNRADLVVTLNEAQEQIARAQLPGVRVARLGNPYIAGARTPLGVAAEPRLNFVARFIPTKDPLTLIAAASRLASPPLLRLMGDGELEAEARAAAEAAGLRAEFPGWRPAPFSHFHHNDVLVLPSHWEGLPYLLQEALDHGVPIIASDIAGNRAALADGAYGALFPPGDAAALAAAIEQAMADLDALRAKAEKGRAALAARYGGQPFWRALSSELAGAR